MKTCKVDGCDRAVKGRGWCGMHWLRWRKYGDPSVVKRPGVDYMTKSPCSVDGCSRLAHAHGFCTLHLVRWKKHGDPLHIEPIKGRPLKGDVPSWGAVHKRLSRKRGRASEFRCVDCGNPAREWSYDHTDPKPLMAPSRNGVMPYSLDLDNYVPRCIACHRRFDASWKSRVRNDAGQFASAGHADECEPGVRIIVRAAA